MTRVCVSVYVIAMTGIIFSIIRISWPRRQTSTPEIWLICLRSIL